MAQRIVNDQDLVAVIGHVFSGCSLAAGPIYSRGKVPMMAVASTNPKVPSAGNYVFRINLSDASAGAEMAKYTIQKLKAKKIAVIIGQSDYCQGVFNAFEGKTKEFGGTIVTLQKFVPGQDKDFSVVLTSVKAAGPDIILVDAYASDAALNRWQGQGSWHQHYAGDPGRSGRPGFYQVGWEVGLMASSPSPTSTPPIKDVKDSKSGQEIRGQIPYRNPDLRAVRLRCDDCGGGGDPDGRQG